LFHQKEKLHDAIFGSYIDHQRMARTEEYKLIRYPKVNETQLFNVQRDPWEMKNLAGDPSYSSVIKDLDRNLLELQKQVGDEMELEPLAP
ncbi:MAG: sulfatase/phosphatase domain-containing protein, partial [Candidatus Hinthialibacter sp.]